MRGKVVSSRRSTALNWTAAALIFAIALATRFIAGEWLPPGFPFLTFFPAVIVTAFFCGLWPGIAVSVASLIASWYFFIPPAYSFELDRNSLVALLFFCFVLVVDLAIIDALMRAKRELERQREEARMFAEQRDTLFREVQHRISNNLQVVSGLIGLQARAIDHPAAREALAHTRSRIATIAAIQRLFHDPERGGRMDADFLRSLAADCIEAAGAAGTTSVTVEGDPFEIGSTAYQPVALIVVECINNALEHGRREGHDLHVAIRTRNTADGHQIVVADDGPGFPDGFDVSRPESVGLKLMSAFARQLNGRLEARNADGATWILTWPRAT